MDKAGLQQCLCEEVDRWSAKPLETLVTELADTVAYTTGEPNALQVEVNLLEHTTEYVHVMVSVDDGGWRAFKPLAASFLVYRDGRVKKPSS